MDIIEKLKGLDALSLDETIEVVKKYYLYIKPENKEDFFKKMCEVSKYLCSEKGFVDHIKSAIKEYYDNEYFNENVLNDISENHIDDMQDALFLLGNLTKYHYVGASLAKVQMKTLGLVNNALDAFVDLNCVMDVIENCDLFLLPQDEKKLSDDITNYMLNHEKDILLAQTNKDLESNITNDFLNILKPYLNEAKNSLFDKVISRSSYQWYDKRYLKESLKQLNKQQLIDFFKLVITFRANAQLFMSKSSAYEMLTEIRPQLNDSQTRTRGQMNKAFKMINEEELRGQLYRHADQNIVLWDNTIEAFLQRKKISDAYDHVMFTLSLKNQTKGTNINILM